MAKRQRRSQPYWTDVKANLENLDRKGLTGLIQDLYAAHEDNQAFLHVRFGVTGDALRFYKETIRRCIWPDVLKNENPSVARATQMISIYKDAAGKPEELVELMVYYCECAVNYRSDIGWEEPDYLGALDRMFEEALKAIAKLPPRSRNAPITRLKDLYTTGMVGNVDRQWRKYWKDVQG